LEFCPRSFLLLCLCGYSYSSLQGLLQNVRCRT
jgi:hypothetical protein